MRLEHEKPRPEWLAEPAARDDVHVAASAVRCPFCHDSVAPEASDWIACKVCLARHHEACWSESKKCATCGHESSLSPTGEGARPRRVPSGARGPAFEQALEQDVQALDRRQRIRRIVVRIALVMAVILVVGVCALQVHRLALTWQNF